MSNENQQMFDAPEGAGNQHAPQTDRDPLQNPDINHKKPSQSMKKKI